MMGLNLLQHGPRIDSDGSPLSKRAANFRTTPMTVVTMLELLLGRATAAFLDVNGQKDSCMEHLQSCKMHCREIYGIQLDCKEVICASRFGKRLQRGMSPFNLSSNLLRQLQPQWIHWIRSTKTWSCRHWWSAYVSDSFLNGKALLDGLRA